MMSTFDELKKNWRSEKGTFTDLPQYDQQAFDQLIRSKVKKQTHMAMQYFWGAFTLQILVYALLCHVLVKYGGDTELLWPGIGGILLFLPFTVMLIRKFKQVATTSLNGTTGASIYQHIKRRHDLLLSFYRFKLRYELLLIPISSIIGVFLTFKLYVPGGVHSHWVGTTITVIITLLSCTVAIRRENRKHFKRPLARLREVLEEFGEKAD